MNYFHRTKQKMKMETRNYEKYSVQFANKEFLEKIQHSCNAKMSE